MAVNQRRLMNTYDKYKKKGLSDTEAMEKAIKDSSAATLAIKEAEYQRKKKDTWVSKLKMAVTGKIAKSKQSPAGRKHLEGK